MTSMCAVGISSTIAMGASREEDFCAVRDVVGECGCDSLAKAFFGGFWGVACRYEIDGRMKVYFWYSS